MTRGKSGVARKTRKNVASGIRLGKKPGEIFLKVPNDLKENTKNDKN